VLLQNSNSALPLHNAVKKIAAFGNTSYDFIAGGTGSGDVNEAYTVSLAQGLSNAGLLLDGGLQKAYEKHVAAERAKQGPKKFFWELPAPLAEMAIDDAQLQQATATNDLAVVTIGRNSGEFQDRQVNNDFNLNEAEQKLIDKVSKAFHEKGKKLIVILNIGGVIETASWKQKADAIVLAWQGGQEAGNAVADILTGKVNPSGKLTMSFPIAYTDVPSATSFPGIELSATDVKGPSGMSMGKPSQVTYEEGIYVGYRYYQTFGKEVSYPFGHGLSYTNFSYDKLQVNKQSADGTIEATVEVRNSGTKAGREVVQLYVAAPGKDMHKPASELKAFAKTKLLTPGETELIRFRLLAKDLASFDESSTAWVAESGNYKLLTGKSSAALDLKAGFSIPNRIIAEQCQKVLVPKTAVTELQTVLR
jgi:beta-glucosidase